MVAGLGNDPSGPHGRRIYSPPRLLSGLPRDIIMAGGAGFEPAEDLRPRLLSRQVV